MSTMFIGLQLRSGAAGPVGSRVGWLRSSLVSSLGNALNSAVVKMFSKKLQQLNPPQREAVETLSGPLLVLAGAGTGKTRVVTYRIARLIQSGIAPNRILAVTFTNKAAGEMQERVGELLGRRRKLKPEISTFHSYCVRLLKRHIDKLGYRKKFTIFAGGQQESQARRILREVDMSGSLLKPSELLSFISRWKSAGLNAMQALEVADSDKAHLAAVAYRRYQESLVNMNALDFDDLLLLSERLFLEHKAVRVEEAARFDHVLVDEYQDTNSTQYTIVRSLAESHQNLCVVGDDDQSIYGWRGAEVKHILGFRRDWPQAKVVRLEDNYRSAGQIIKFANTLIRYNDSRHDKRLIASRGDGPEPRILKFEDEEKEAEAIVADIRVKLDSGQYQPSDFAILFRTNEQPRVFETQLREAKVPYILMGSMSFYDRREVRDLLAYMKLLDDPNDETSLLRVINRPARGIGSKSVAAALQYATRQEKPMWDVIQNPQQVKELGPAAVASIAEFAALIDQYRSRAQRHTPEKVVRDLLDQIDYQKELKRTCADFAEQESRWESILAVIQALTEYLDTHEGASVGDYLNDLMLSLQDTPGDKERELSRNCVYLMTFHAAKGLEFPYVYLIGLEEGILPHRRSVDTADGVDEERRLCYVGVTRAQETLTLSCALARRKWGKPQVSHPSRFLYEMLGQADHPRATQARDWLANQRRAASARARQDAAAAELAPKKKPARSKKATKKRNPK
jgi:DNA helicase-2/ATP-dependent DNA helicase PcrA